MRNTSRTIIAILIVLVGFVLISNLGMNLPLAHAQGPVTPVPKTLSNTPYFTASTRILSNGSSVDEYIINGPPAPPPGYEAERVPVPLPKVNKPAGTNTLIVPAFNWVFGCSSVSGAMIAGYYDRNGYPNMYTGPTNGGVMPLDNSSWPYWIDGTATLYPNLPLAASHQGVDGRATRGSIDDYWVAYDSAASDPYITGGWTQHTWSDAIGDYMKTSQSAYGNIDGSTIFYNWKYSASPFTCSQMVTNNISNQDGTYGRKLFYEARGYTVTDCYNQKTDNNGGGFTFALYKAEIDAGRPVMLNLQGHTVVGVGYDDSTNTVYIHDTWDYIDHMMTWGGSYSNMPLLSVSIVNLQQVANPVPSITSLNPSSALAGGPAFTLTVNGSNFVNGSQVRWNGSNRTTTYASSTQLTAAITAADIAAPSTASVTVFNPAPGGGTSNAISFVVSSINPVPSITSLNPPSTATGGPAFTLTVNGSNFVNGSQVRWNGANRTTTYVSGAQLTAAISAADIASPTTASVTVFNPAPGGGTSNSVSFSVTTGSQVFLPFISRNDPTWTTLVTTDFEGTWPFPWVVYDGNGVTGGEYYWGRRNCRPYAGGYSGWGVGAGANGTGLGCGAYYPNDVNSWMVYGPFSLTGATAAELRYKLWMNAESTYDTVCRFASINGTNYYGTCTSGYTGGWIDRVLDLSNVYMLGDLRGQPNVWIAIRFYSDSSVTYAEGGYVDNITLRVCPAGSICPAGSSPALPISSQEFEFSSNMVKSK